MPNFKNCGLIILAFLTFILNSCATATEKSFEIAHLESDSKTFTLPLKYTSTGLITLPLETEFGSRQFLLDTGATRSALFTGSDDALIASVIRQGSANVYGLTDSGEFPLVKIAKLKIGPRDITGTTFALLPKRQNRNAGFEGYEIVGILGMDILGRFNIMVDAETQKIHLLPPNYSSFVQSQDWTPIDLFPNPHSDDDKNLHFFNIRIGNHVLPAILDSGVEFNVINWQATIVPELKRLRRRLLQDWEMQGAVGTFDPTVRINVDGMRAGLKLWGRHQFIVMSFDHLDGIGFKDKPLIVAGAEIFNRKSFFVDFKNDRLWFEGRPIPRSQD